MFKNLGTLIAVAGLAGVIYYSYEYFQASESFEMMGADVAVSTGDYVPILISAIVMIGGALLAKMGSSKG